MATFSVSKENQNEWTSCKFCKGPKFRELQNFTSHLREEHCTKDGLFVTCHYVPNGVCSNSLTEAEFEAHALRHHAEIGDTLPIVDRKCESSSSTALVPSRKLSLSQSKKSIAEGSAETPGDVVKWTVYSGSQNLPAVLNDPSRGKQKDFFTKLWGDSFVEKTDIPPSLLLPEIPSAYFESYLRKFGKRHRRHDRMKVNVPPPEGHNQVLHTFPNLRVPSSRFTDQLRLEVDAIPPIFLQSNFDLSDQETFNAVYHVPSQKENSDNPTASGLIPTSAASGKLLQEQLSHYLDMVEVQIAHQVAHKSDAFFMAMRSHDALMEQMTETVTAVKILRANLQQLDQNVVHDSLKILKLKRSRTNHMRTYQKMKLMSSVRETQPMIQLLLSTPDYVAALDLIQTSQEMLKQELAGIHSFRHLGSQLHEMCKLIDKMLSTEFERYATADLNRPLTSEQNVLEGDKLVSIILGLLRKKHFNFIDTYKSEAFTTIRAVLKQLVIETVAASDIASNDTDLSLGDQMQALSVSEWFKLLQQGTNTLMRLILRVKAVHDVMRDAADVSAGLTLRSKDDSGQDDSSNSHLVSVCEPPDIFLTAEEHERICSKLEEMLAAVCDAAHERCAQLLCAQPSNVHSVREGASMTHSQTNAVVNGDSSNGTNHVTSGNSNSNNQVTAGWLVERATPLQVCALNKIVEDFCDRCQQICGRQSSSLRCAFKMQASKFVVRFHQERRTKLGLILDSERWKQADVPAEFQALVDQIHKTGTFGPHKPDLRNNEPDQEQPKSDQLLIGQERFAVVGTVLLLVRMAADYCSCASDLPVCSSALSRSVAELLMLFNSRCCQLVLGAGAIQSAGLDTITTTNLALASRSLQLLLWLIPFLRNHFSELLLNSPNVSANGAGHTSLRATSGSSLSNLDTVERDVTSHVREIEEKVLTIVSSLLTIQLDRWEVKPPVPSQPFRNISRHLSKLHKAVASIMPDKQVQRLYLSMHLSFKDQVRSHLNRIGVVNNGGPQHGLVTAELTFYLETLRSLKVLPSEQLGDQTLEEVWR